MHRLKARLPLPDELLYTIFQHVDQRTCASAALVCKQFHSQATAVLYSRPTLTGTTLWSFKRTMGADASKASSVQRLSLAWHASTEAMTLQAIMTFHTLDALPNLRAAHLEVPHDASPYLRAWLSDSRGSAQRVHTLSLFLVGSSIYAPADTLSSDDDDDEDDDGDSRPSAQIECFMAAFALPALRTLTLCIEEPRTRFAASSFSPVAPHIPPADLGASGVTTLRLEVYNVNMNVIEDLIRVPRALSSLELRLSYRDAADGDELLPALTAHAPTLEHLELFFQPLVAAGYHGPVSSLKALSSLKSLSICEPFLFPLFINPAETAHLLVDLLPPSLERLDLWLYHIGREGLEARINTLIHLIEYLPCLRVLALDRPSEPLVISEHDSSSDALQRLDERLTRECRTRGIEMQTLVLQSVLVAGPPDDQGEGSESGQDWSDEDTSSTDSEEVIVIDSD